MKNSMDETRDRMAEEQWQSAVENKYCCVEHLCKDSFVRGFDARGKIEDERVEKLVDKVDKIANRLGLDTQVVQVEAVWTDPKNVSAHMEQTIKNNSKFFCELKEALKEFREGKE